MTGAETGAIIVIPVGGVMTRRLVTVTPETARDFARRLMDEHGIRHLPVVAGGRLVGMLSDRDLRSAGASGPGPVDGIMTRESLTVTSAPASTRPPSARSSWATCCRPGSAKTLPASAASTPACRSRSRRSPSTRCAARD